MLSREALRLRLGIYLCAGCLPYVYCGVSTLKQFLKRRSGGGPIIVFDSCDLLLDVCDHVKAAVVPIVLFGSFHVCFGPGCVLYLCQKVSDNLCIIKLCTSRTGVYLVYRTVCEVYGDE